VTQALVLSVLNVGGAMLYAHYGLPLLVHVRGAVKLVGLISTILYVTWVVVINLSIGHFRDLFIQNAGQVAAADLLGRLSVAPFTFVDVRSLVLVALGILLSIVALIDARGMQDIYLGYGAVGRRRLDAVTAYADHKARCLAGLTDRRDAAIADMAEVIKEMRTADYDLRLAVDGRTRLHENYRAYLRHLSDGYVRLMQRYREANVGARSAPAPARFESRASAPSFLADVLPLEPIDFRGDSREQVVTRMEHFIRAINQEFQAAVQRYETVAGLAGQATS
jgi:hypothetical protein